MYFNTNLQIKPTNEQLQLITAGNVLSAMMFNGNIPMLAIFPVNCSNLFKLPKLHNFYSGNIDENL